MSRMHTPAIDLRRLVEVSQVIALVRPPEEPPTQCTIRLGRGIRTYTYTCNRHSVLQVIRPSSLNRDESLAITTFTADNLRQHIEYYVHGLSRSSIVESYSSEISSATDPGAPSVLFLTRNLFFTYGVASDRLCKRVDALAPVCRGARESAARLSDITALVKAQDTPEVGIARATPGCEAIIGVPRKTAKVERRVSDQISKLVKAGSLGGCCWQLVEMTKPVRGSRK